MTAVIAIIVVTALLLFGILVTYGIGVREIERREREAMAELGLAYDWDNLSDAELDELEEQGIIEWISAEEVAERKQSRLGTLLTRERPAKPSEVVAEPLPTTTSVAQMKEPVFSVGDTVVTVNPFTRSFVYDDYDGTPLYFEIMDVLIDPDDSTYRYLISGEEEWVAEDWLKYPGVAMMVKEEVSGVSKVTAEATSKRGRELAEIAEAYIRQHTIDTYLDMMNSYDPKVNAEGRRLLAAYLAAEQAEESKEE